MLANTHSFVNKAKIKLTTKSQLIGRNHCSLFDVFSHGNIAQSQIPLEENVCLVSRVFIHITGQHKVVGAHK